MDILVLLCKMGFTKDERVQVKAEFMRMLLRMQLDPARMELLAVFFETYLKLNQQEEERFQRELEKIDEKEASAIMQLRTTWHEEGYAKGKLEGKLEDARNMLSLGLDVDIVVRIHWT